jgi:hypothetical protein
MTSSTLGWWKLMLWFSPPKSKKFSVHLFKKSASTLQPGRLIIYLDRVFNCSSIQYIHTRPSLQSQSRNSAGRAHGRAIMFVFIWEFTINFISLKCTQPNSFENWLLLKDESLSKHQLSSALWLHWPHMIHNHYFFIRQREWANEEIFAISWGAFHCYDHATKLLCVM